MPFSSGHNDRLIIFKVLAWYALSDKEQGKILSCESELMLRSYLNGVFHAAAYLWKSVVPVNARAVFQRDVFHSATVFQKLQSRLSMTLGQRIFDKYVFIHIFIYYSIFLLFYISIIFIIFYILAVGATRNTSHDTSALLPFL